MTYAVSGLPCAYGEFADRRQYKGRKNGRRSLRTRELAKLAAHDLLLSAQGLTKSVTDPGRLFGPTCP